MQAIEGAAKVVNSVWSNVGGVVSGLFHVGSHEARIREIEKDLAEHGESINFLMRWLEDHENRLALLEHFENYDLAEVRCADCGAPMRVKRNHQSREFFLGCVKYRGDPATGKPQCGTKRFSKHDLLSLARRLRPAA
ncbi:MAG: zinc ribbon domain-containing protein [Gammaproteobacteria bacterium]